jgi:hypothetical protein
VATDSTEYGMTIVGRFGGGCVLLLTDDFLQAFPQCLWTGSEKGEIKTRIITDFVSHYVFVCL